MNEKTPKTETQKIPIIKPPEIVTIDNAEYLALKKRHDDLTAEVEGNKKSSEHKTQLETLSKDLEAFFKKQSEPVKVELKKEYSLWNDLCDLQNW